MPAATEGVRTPRTPPVVWRDGELSNPQGAAGDNAASVAAVDTVVPAAVPAYAFATAAAPPMVPAAAASPVVATHVAAPVPAPDVTPQMPAYVPPWSGGGLRRRWPR